MASPTYLWAKILACIEQRHNAVLVDTWFDDVDVVELRDNTLVLHTSNEYRKNILETQCMIYINEAMTAIGMGDVRVLILDDDGLQDYNNREKSSDELDAIKQEFTFDSFVVGSSNRFAHAAAEAVAHMPAEAYNPLLIYGESGLGKTHLLYAIANVIKADHPDYHIVYVKGDQFTNELIDAIKNGKNVEFRNKYRTADLFLMDDIQFIAGRESTQEEFFHTFNTLFEAKKQIVMTSDRTPDNMSKLEDRLKTRFQWGLLADIQPPDYETRVAIVEKKAENISLSLPDDVVQYVADNVTSNVRQLEGTVNRIKAYRDIDGMEVNLTNVARAIKDMFRGKEKVLPSPALIIGEVCAYYNMEESVIRGTARDKKVAEARQVAMYLIRSMTNLSQDDTGLEFGKDRTTVLHSERKIEQQLASDHRLQSMIQEISSNINAKL